MELWKLDLRILERMLAKGEVKEKDYEGFLRELRDMEGKYEESSLEELLPPGLLRKLMGKSEERDEGKESRRKEKEE